MKIPQLDPSQAEPLYVQLVRHLRTAIISGAIQPGEPLPSTRNLAASLDINFHTVRRSYQELAQIGLINAQRGGRYRVAQAIPADAITDLLREDARRMARRAVALGVKPLQAIGILSEELSSAQLALDD